MTEPDSVDNGEQALKPWPLHERVVKALKGLSPFGVILAWGLAAISALLFLADSGTTDACWGFSCYPVLGFVVAAAVVVLPVTTVAIALLGLMTLLRFSMATRLWTAAVAPPVGLVVMVLVLG